MRRSTRILPELDTSCPYETLERERLSSLERRWLRGDMIEVYKILKGIDRIDFEGHRYHGVHSMAGMSKIRGHWVKDDI